jgi:Tol biopolymer transport system component
VHLGPGNAYSLSPDGRWALVSPKLPYNTLVLYPTGPGEARSLPPGPFAEIAWAQWSPDGRRIVMGAREPGGPYRLWVQDLASGGPRLLDEREVGDHSTPSPDGRQMVARLSGSGAEPERLYVVPLDGRPPRPSNLPSDLTPLQWTADGRGLFMARLGGERPAHAIEVSIVELATGKRTPWRTLAPPDIVGVPRRGNRARIKVTPDGRWYAYPYIRTIADLYVVEGLR